MALLWTCLTFFRMFSVHVLMFMLDRGQFICPIVENLEIPKIPTYKCHCKREYVYVGVHLHPNLCILLLQCIEASKAPKSPTKFSQNSSFKIFKIVA